MKSNLIIVVSLVVFILASCAPENMVIPETKTVSPTTTASQTQTPIPTETNTPEATATKALTPEQQAFLEEGYDEKSSLTEGVLYGILDESSAVYMPDGGIKVEKGEHVGYALSTMELTYYNPDTKAFEKAKFVSDWSIEDGYGYYFTYPTDGGMAAGDPVVIGQATTKNWREYYFGFDPKKKPFIRIIFDFQVPGGFKAINDFFDAAFPKYEGEISFITIPGLGKVLAIKGIVPEGYPNW